MSLFAALVLIGCFLLAAYWYEKEAAKEMLVGPWVRQRKWWSGLDGDKKLLHVSYAILLVGVLTGIIAVFFSVQSQRTAATSSNAAELSATAAQKSVNEFARLVAVETTPAVYVDCTWSLIPPHEYILYFDSEPVYKATFLREFGINVEDTSRFKLLFHKAFMGPKTATCAVKNYSRLPAQYIQLYICYQFGENRNGKTSTSVKRLLPIQLAGVGAGETQSIWFVNEDPEQTVEFQFLRHAKVVSPLTGSELSFELPDQAYEQVELFPVSGKPTGIPPFEGIPFRL